MQTYEQILEKHPEFEGVISPKSWDHIKYSDEGTVSWLQKYWIENLRKNIESKRFKRHGGLDRDCIGFGKNKAIIGIGAGKSLNKNKHILKQIHDWDGVKDPEERNFILIASNHMFKPLLNDGIIPDFVMVADASDVVLDQLTKDIPESGRNTVLIAGLHCSPKVLKRWEKQGRDIRFYLTASPGIPDEYEKLTGNNPLAVIISQGGNVLNSCWSMGLKFFKSSIFMAVGNDLSYELHDDIEKRRNNYYADFDYSSNIANKRDEAKNPKEGWMGFTLERTNIISMDAVKKYNIELNPVGTTGTLWVYKTWIESQVLANSNQNKFSYNYFNCTEGGIAGVMTRAENIEDRSKIDNWFMLDDVSKRWRTRMLEDAAGEFLRAKDRLKCVSGVHHAIGGAARI